MKNILVTGGAGFIGSNFVHHMLQNHDYHIINIDALTYAGNLDNLRDVENDPRYTFVKADIRDRDALTAVFEKYGIDTVVNFAAESHVDRSITEPEIFLTTNVIGTQTLLDVAKRFWKTAPDDKYSREYKEGVKYLQVSTDEVYGALGKTGMFEETTPLSPNSPYSASKASADMVVRAYHETFGMPVNITRCSNNYEKANIEIVRLIIRTLGKSEELIQHVKDRPGHDRRYAIDNTKITTQLGWAPKYTFEQGIAETIEWYCTHGEWMEKITSGDYMHYYDKMYRAAR